MNLIATFLAAVDQSAAAWLSVLVDAALKAAVLILLVAIISRLLRRASASARHLGWLIALAMLPALPILLLTLPAWQVLPDLSQLVSPSTLSPSTLSPSALSPSTQPLSTVADVVPASDAAIETTSPAVGVNPASVAVPAAPQRPLATRALDMHWPTLLFSIWVIGCVATLAGWSAGTISLWRLRRRATQIDAGPLASLLQQLAARLNIRRPVQLLTSHERRMPMQWGVVRPQILLPAAAATWPQDRLTAVLLHELGHVRRSDCAAQLVATLVGAMYWFHPLVWWAVRRLKAESELACDNEVLAAGCGSADYAEHLLHVAAHSGGTTLPAAAIAMARYTDLEGRVRAILGSAHSRRRASLTGTAACLAVLTVATTVLAALRVETKTIAAATHDTAAVATSQPAALLTLGHVDDTAEGRRSIAGSGHAVRFERPSGDQHSDADRLVAVEIFASRYGHEEPPAEDFHVYVLDENHRLLHAAPYPYKLIERSTARWYSLKLPALEVPDRFVVALAFNPHRTKGIYLGYDEDVEESHSLIGRPTTGYEPITESRDWMVRAVLVPDAPLANPFESDDDN